MPPSHARGTPSPRHLRARNAAPVRPVRIHAVGSSNGSSNTSQKKWQHNGSSNTTIHLSTKTIHLPAVGNHHNEGFKMIHDGVQAAVGGSGVRSRCPGWQAARPTGGGCGLRCEGSLLPDAAVQRGAGSRPSSGGGTRSIRFVTGSFSPLLSNSLVSER